jgi:hypothetical protein
MKALFLFLAGVSAAFIMAGCAKPPTQEMTDARAAVDNAVRIGADDYAADVLKTAQDALMEATTRLEEKSYKAARQGAIIAKTKAEEAVAAVAEGKKQVKEEAAPRLKALKDDVEALLAKVSKSKTKASESIRKEIASLKGEVGAAQGDMDAERYKAALEKAGSLEEKLKDLKTKAEEALKKPAAPKKKRK